MSESTPEFEQLLDYLKRTRGFDFGMYKRSTLQRRVQKRMAVANAATYSAYTDYLEVHQNEFRDLFNTILINVTSFFRDKEAWDLIASDVIPKIVERKGPTDPIRIWVAGCASGEEAYSVAMLLAEHVGVSAFRERVKIYATDLDDEALSQSRLATYTAKDVEAVPEELVSKYFESVCDKLVFDRELRRSIIFGKHDLVQDAPISRVDLLLCRNTLMYFNAEAQDRIFTRFHFALLDGAFLFLGMAETMLTHTALFQPIDLKHRIFVKVPRSRQRDRSVMLGSVTHDTRGHGDIEIRLADAAMDNSPVALMALDLNGTLCLANERARAWFGLSIRDLGRPIQDLDFSYKPVEIRSGIDQAFVQRRTVTYKDVAWAPPGADMLVLDLRVTPVVGHGGEIIGVAVTAEDVTHFKRLQEELVNINQELETAYEEVQSTNEELQTTNEELQSTVEELETTNEELQSTNEELETINEELRVRSTNLNQTNAFMESVMASLRDGVIVVDRDLKILAWNSKSEDLWGLRADEVRSKHLLNLDTGLPVDQLMQPVRLCLQGAGPQQTAFEATNRRGRKVKCETSCTPLLDLDGTIRGAILLISDSELA